MDNIALRDGLAAASKGSLELVAGVLGCDIGGTRKDLASRILRRIPAFMSEMGDLRQTLARARKGVAAAQNALRGGGQDGFAQKQGWVRSTLSSKAIKSCS